MTGLLLVEGVDNLAETDVDLVECITACGVIEETVFDGDADFPVCFSEFLFCRAWGDVKLSEKCGVEFLFFLCLSVNIAQFHAQ